MPAYQFGPFILDTRTYELRRDGNLVAIEPQVFGLLKYLIEHRDRVVSKDELIESVWGGRIVSDATVSSRVSAARVAVHDTGEQQAIIRTLPRRGFRFVADIVELVASATSGQPVAAVAGARTVAAGTEPPADPTDRQRIQFCVSKDGTTIAFATTGAGYPLVRAGHWLTHLEFDWQSPVWRPYLDELGRHFRVTRYDQRGNGLSDWSVADFSLDRFVEDLEAVVAAAGLKRFALLGSSQGAPISVAYAVRHPDRVSHLILHGGYAQGRLVRGSIEEREQGEALLTLIRHGWGKPGSPFLKAFTSMYIPGGTTEQIDSLVELQRQTTTPENAARLRAAVDRFDVTGLLDKVAVPTLVVHARNDGVQPLEEGRRLSAGIRDSEFLMLDSSNHALLRTDAAWDVFFERLRNFVLG
jgi:DNA-binding winged helix-turn-helix (wHTH) protein/pimeloyl-ACP methyl ester carboxylesterase